MSTKRFEEVPHTADLAIRVWGRDMAELFVNAAYGMACQLGDPESVTPVSYTHLTLPTIYSV